MNKLRINYFNNEFPVPLRKHLLAPFKVKYGYPLDWPQYVWIEITSECNLRCIMCPQSRGLKRKNMTMAMDAFVKIIDQIYMNRPWVILHVSGEPLLNKNLFEMIEYAKKRGCCATIHTNATLLSEEMSIRILQSSLDWISFSFDGCTPEIYEKVRVGAEFEQVKSQIETFLKLRYEMKLKTPYTVIEIILMQETKPYILDFIKYWQTKGVDEVGIRPVGNWIGLIEDHRVIKPRNFGQKPCKFIFFACAILVDGTVVPCCIDIAGRLPLGNILRQPFDEIWNGHLYNRLRTQHLKHTIPENIICYDCFCTWRRSSRERITQWFLKQFFGVRPLYAVNLRIIEKYARELDFLEGFGIKHR